MQEYKRWQVESIQDSLKIWRVVVISGPRQIGKKTIIQQIVKEDNGVIRNLDDENLLLLALESPKDFVKNTKGIMIIDEIQRAPNLMLAIKMAVDANNRKGQYLLTGSANIRTLPKIADSLAGRITHIRLRPLTNGEIMRKKPLFLERAFTNNFQSQIKGYDKDKIFDLAFRGGYPEAVKIKDQSIRRQWYLDYINSIIKLDLRDIENIRRQDSLLDLIKIMAGWSSKYMDFAKIGRSLELSKPTLETYKNLLELLFIYESVPAWITDYEYIGRKPKYFSTDTGLMTSILNWNKDDVMLDRDRSGKLMETFVFQELAAQIDLKRHNYKLYQYRDYLNHEIDFLIERDDKSLVGIEVKSGSSVSKDHFKSHKWFKENIIRKKHPYTGIVLYSGEETLRFDKDMIAVPIAALWME